jgi:hypothetical protein
VTRPREADRAEEGEMSEHDNGHNDDLRASLALLSERMTDVFLRTETLRILLTECGVFSKADFNMKFQELHELWIARVYFLYSAKREDDKLVKLLRLLESLEAAKS